MILVTKNSTKEIDLSGFRYDFILKKGNLYLGSTYEIIGSKKFAMSLIRRRSLERLGSFLRISANLGNISSNHKWTLEIVACKDIKVYDNMIISQISF